MRPTYKGQSVVYIGSPVEKEDGMYCGVMYLTQSYFLHTGIQTTHVFWILMNNEGESVYTKSTNLVLQKEWIEASNAFVKLLGEIRNVSPHML